MMPTIIIVLISAFAFVIGAYQVQVTHDLSNKNDDLNQMQYKYDVSEKYTNGIVDLDNQYLTKSEAALTDAYQLSLRYGIENATLNQTERDFLLLQIDSKISDSIQWTKVTYAYAYALFFYDNPNENSYYLLKQSESGFDLVITRAEWNKVVPVYTENMSDWLILWGFDPTFVQVLLTSQFSPGTTYPGYFLTDLQSIFYDILDGILANINNLKNDVHYYYNLNNLLILSVGISTLGTVLSATISTRRDNNENEVEFSTLRSAFYNDSSMEMKFKDKFSMVILGIAFLASLIGLLLPLLLPK